MLGGYNIFGVNSSIRKTYSTPIPHYQLKLSIRLFLIGSLDNNNNARLYIDNELRIDFNPRVYPTYEPYDKCGDPGWKDGEKVLESPVFSHTS